MKLNGSVVSLDALVRELCWNSDPASSDPDSVGSFVVDSSSGPAGFLCSYVEHSFPFVYIIFMETLYEI